MKTKKLKPNSKNILTYLPVFGGFYGSLWEEPDFYGEAEHYKLPENFPFYEYVNWSDYYTALSKSFCNTIEKDMSKWIEKIEFVELWSPKEYNFMNDRIECIIRPKIKEVQKFIYENKQAFEQWLIDNHKSRDGFISFQPHTFEEWEENTKNFTDFTSADGYIQLGSILNFIACTQDETELSIDNLYYGASDIDISEFFTEKFYKIAEGSEEIKKFVKENYQHENVRELAIDKFTNEDDYPHLTHEKIKSAINEAINEIEEQTLKLIF